MAARLANDRRWSSSFDNFSPLPRIRHTIGTESIFWVGLSRFAIDGKAPHSDLYVSPAHALSIPAMSTAS